MRRQSILICWILAALVGLSAQARPDSAQSEFIVLRTDRVAIPEGQTTGLNCSIVGSGNTAQISCESHSSGCDPHASDNAYGSAPCEIGTGLGRKLGTRPSVYHVALVVGSNQVGYLVSCSGGGLIKKGCQPLATGQVLKGTVHGDKLSLALDSKVRNYTVETSAYIGPLTATGEATTPASEEHGPEANVKLAVEESRQSDPTPKAHTDQTLGSEEATVLFSSEPSGADIYVDGKFVGNAPSQIQLSVGPHTIRVEAKGEKPWTRELSLSPGGKITIHAVLEAGPQT